ncbi:hypothetical protein DXG01_016684, partial [Tephrocybe rancida]
MIPVNPEDTYKPALTFRVATSDHFNTYESDVALIAESLKIDTLDKSLKYVKLLVQAATAVAEVNPISKAVLSLTGLLVSA